MVRAALKVRAARRFGCIILCGAFLACVAFAKPMPNGEKADRIESGRTLLIVHAGALAEVAKQWSAYRSAAQGGSWRVQLYESQPSDDLDAQRNAIQGAIQQAYREAAPQREDQFAVLLLGDAEPNGVPPWKFPQPDPVLQGGRDFEFITDHPYQVIEGKGFKPDFALGRIPARNPDEALAALSKIKAYEQTSAVTGDGRILPGRNRVVYAAGEGRFGVMDSILESLFKKMVDRMVPDAFDMSMTYAKSSSIYCPPPSKLTSTVLERMSEGALLFNYIGHGYARGFDSLHWNGKRIPILRTGDLKGLPNQSRGQLPIAFFSACSTGCYDLPNGEHSLAEAMLFHPAGPAAIIAGSRITHPYANTILQMDITRALLVERTPTLGMLDLRAMQSMLKVDDVDRELDAIATPIAFAGKWKTSLMGLRQMHVQLYNLFGDPAMRLALPGQAIEAFQLAENQISGRIANMKTGTVVLTAETPRIEFVNAAKLMAIAGDNDPDLETKAANNYPLVNDRVVTRIEAKVIDGAFSFQLKEPLAKTAAILRAYAIGQSEDGTTIDAIGAVRLPTLASTSIQVKDNRPSSQ